MGKIVYAAKITHIPRMILSEQPGPLHGCRDDAVEGLREVGRRILDAGAETLIVLDTHWLSNAGYHVNCASRFDGVYSSSEFPTQLKDLEYHAPGDPELGHAIAAAASAAGVPTFAHENKAMWLEYGTLVPLHFMNTGDRLKVVSMSGWLAWASIDESRKVGAALRAAIEASDRKVAVLASGSLSHRIHDNAVVLDHPYEISDEFNRQCDLRALDLWTQGRWKEFAGMLPTYARACSGEGWMHDTAMLMGALGWDAYQGCAEVIVPYFIASGTGQVIAQFPIAA
ncbi:MULTISPECIES: 3,4-dihydroxyphenylacetate 2,3-dioxygenase [unclassified Novosphingobium]|uniref:3,4-dihydroxyphenylacetate 2,3-dioxygenase n=1 Tax=unclassified Novosphingobium TaxID=2644732 RepID=UPI00086C1206|nr:MULTISPECIES: 3,4-dihydroxyphenylacetate 2,3-dioxygenase [unclassified Novosphingobium]MBN9145851.1 3,4-dihydroxyphenylacetate 2,3-dioxygenase [Novosphingobium sp.]MDR6706595.1 3,4-dihydroxyphenylacetate 2,3-dioxygenase [Novosphingobium sp. 1748]ODU76613.1 MAG: 3,4-dihydroxyphenylacetate 2,3-dioxygenase [Novosphingobium sp. SCN 63-17]OJX97233.1 MAG: 3,4-dihydroxyphenylacetate 2,3-dioxygenase [Novosphingobium sp. 63-713]